MVLTVCYLCFVRKLDDPKKSKLGFLRVSGMLAAAAASLFFGWLAEEVIEAHTHQFDDAVRMAIHRLTSPPLTSAMQVFSFPGSVRLLLTLTVLAIILILYFRRRRAAALLAIAVAGAYALEIVLKDAFHRSRPAAFFRTAPPSVYLGVPYPNDVLAGYYAGLVWIGTIGILDKALRSGVSVRPEPSGSASNLP